MSAFGSTARWAAVAWLCLLSCPETASAGAAVYAVAAERHRSANVDCHLTNPQANWIQTALDGWERVSGEFLRLEPSPLPWTILFDGTCAWHLAPDASMLSDASRVSTALVFRGEPIVVRALPHENAVWLPTGGTIPIQSTAFASLYEGGDGSTPFFVLALPDLWREEPDGNADSGLEAEILGVFSHEIVHTRQLVHAAARVAELEKRYGLPESIGDDIIEQRFGEVRGFRDAHEAETDLFYQAVVEDDPERKRALIARALELVQTRQANYFSGPNVVYRELEELFLNMEGVAVWAAYRLSRADPTFDIGIADPAADRKRNTWSQDQGLALFLLIDELVPGWRERAPGPELASPFRLLGRSLLPDR